MPSKLREIARLATLRDSGDLTGDEFDAETLACCTNIQRHRRPPGV